VAPLVVLVASLFGLRLVGVVVPLFGDWQADGRYALALMLLLTASAYFVDAPRCWTGESAHHARLLEQLLTGTRSAVRRLIDAGQQSPWSTSNQEKQPPVHQRPRAQ
jgi:hypothetical protein